jgi:two-component system, NtrC family, response regulator AtoC
MSCVILIIDDEPHLPHQFARFLRKRGFETFTAASGEEGLAELKKNVIDLVLLDVRLPGMNGLEVLIEIRKHDAELPVIMLTAFGDTQTAVSAMKLGALDYLTKGFDLEELLLVIQRGLDTSAMYRELRQLRRERSDNYHFSYIIGQSERMREVFDLVARVARSETASVLITGESGTGKEVIARAIHEQSQRASGPFHPLNCAAISSSLLESELFGFEQYAFTDARRQKRGLLELADGGTLFLDEIGEMPLEMQAKLLRVLETRSFYRLGGNKEVRINVRVLAATNRNLEEALKAGMFRADLFFRLAVLRIDLPPLRERPGDILLFAARFIDDFNTLLGRTVRRVSPEAQRLLQAYAWPGNVRELKNVIERAMILSSGDELAAEHFPKEIVGRTEHGEASPTDPWEHWLSLHPPGPVSLEEVVARAEQFFLRRAMQASKQNRTRAAKLLGFAKVDQLRYLLRKYEMD